jgi:hypothetical protein
MSRWLLTLLTLSAVTVAVVLAIARPGALSRHGTFAQPVAAFPAIATPWAYIDKIENGAGWCDPDAIDITSTEYVGDSHQFALCVGNLTGPVHSFQATIGYDGALDECIDEQCQPVTFGAQTIQLDQGCVDDNPDANAGDTTWPLGSEGLGTGWDCFYYLVDGYSLARELGQDPTCNVPDHASTSQLSAGISCHGTNSYTLGDNETWGALAVINMNVIAAGVDNVDIQTLQVRDSEVTIIACPPVVAGADVNADSVIEGPCQGATDIKREHHRPKPTPTPAPTATPTAEVPTVPPPPPATPTPSGGAGPAIVAPTTGSGPTDSDAPWTLWLAAGLAGAALAAGGFYIRYARSDR